MNLYEAIGCRRSVRRFREREITERQKTQILRFVEEASRLNDGIGLEAVLWSRPEGKEKLKKIPKMDPPCYLALYSDAAPGCERNAGYVLEQTILYLTCKGIGCCVLGGAAPKEKTRGDRRFMILAAIGYPEGRLTRESLLARRLPLKKLCIFRTEANDPMKAVLRSARLAPSAINAQPWRFELSGEKLHIYRYRGLLGRLCGKRMCEISMGMMLSHVMLAADELWLHMETTEENRRMPQDIPAGWEYDITLTFHSA